MQFAYTVRQLKSEQFELRFPDFVGARELFVSEADAHKEALNILLEAVQVRFDNRQRVPEPLAPNAGQHTIMVPGTFEELIAEHHMSMDDLGEIRRTI